ncbi:hypothetical protein ACFOMD_08250 [Sphingoaurantiacus capsulatus]|uniref:Uncharacterized protein n=1 Tax=Sphingoaurantiacus capsulatus TaxID=1771310 RepID=A0ABV7X927_9SPHN
MSDENDDAILNEMLKLVDKLCQSGDALLVGQYRHLRARIDVLLELRGRTEDAA